MSTPTTTDPSATPPTTEPVISVTIPRRPFTPEEECRAFCPNPSGKLQRLCRRLLKPGDHIYVRTGTIYHHGIYAGGTVIHYCSDGRKKAYDSTMAVRETCWHIFTSQRRDVLVEVIDYEEAFDHEHSLFLARQLIGQANYDLFRNNCEHFSSMCRVGFCTSHQVRAVAERGSGVIAVGTAATGGGVIAAAAGSYEVPVLLGSPTLGYWSQSVMANTALGKILAHSGLVATKLVVVPASASVVCFGVLAGAAVGCLGFGGYYLVSRTYDDGSKNACVSILTNTNILKLEGTEVTNKVVKIESLSKIPTKGPLIIPHTVKTSTLLCEFFTNECKDLLATCKTETMKVYLSNGTDDGCYLYVRLDGETESLPRYASYVIVVDEDVPVTPGID